MTPAGRPDASGSRPGAPEHLWRVRLPIAVATAALVAGSATLASAQDPSEPAGQLTDPYATGEQAANQQSLDTDWTPNAKETDLFQQVAGSAWDERRNDPATAFVPGDPRTGVILGSATSFEDNLYTVAFSEQQGVGGIAGGATCEDPEPYSESGCVPVLYQYRTFEPARGLEWRKLELPGADEPGYVGEVAWIGRTGRALAVGGTGTYPRREPAYGKDIDGNDCPTPGPPGQDREPYGARCDQAGMARAWLYDPERFSENGGWCELGPGAPCGAIPEGPRGQQMRGLSALDFDRAQGRELGFAGALGQIWTWKEGRFTGGMVDSTSPECMRVPPNEEGFGGACPGGANSGDAALWLAKLFRFRVREIRFVPGQKDPVAMAVTSGCCTETALTDYPALLVYGGTVGQARQWSLFHLSDEREDGTPTQGSPTCGSGAPFIGLTGPRGAQCALGFAPNTQPQRPDSLYSITVSKNSGQGVYRVSAVASPGGPERPGEPPSTVTARYCRWSGGRSHVDTPGSGGYLTDLEDPLRVNLSTARLVAGDGDVAAVSLNTNRPPAPYLEGSQELSFSPSAPSATDTNGFVPPGGCSSGEGRAVGNNPPDPDSVPDWVVGELRSTDREDLGARGLLLANPQRPSLLPKTIKPNPATSEVADGSYRPTDPDKLQAYASSQYFLLPSYGLGAIDIIGASSSGWAVGDHGAILRLDEKVAKTSVPEPEPPRLGGRRPAELPDAAPYEEAHRAEASGAGPVPGLGAQPLERLAEPRLVPAGSPDPEGPSERGGSGTILGQSVNEIAVSRDGSEGWAVGPFIDRVRGEFSLYRFDGSSWTLCDPFGIAGQRPPDPACEELAEIAEFTDANGNLLATRLRAIARVPLENDSDPTNDDEFEAVAVGSGYIPAGAEEDFAGKVEVPVVLRYREGRWRLEDAQARAAITKTTAGASVTSPLEGLRDVAFTAPDDGWVLGKSGSSWLFHFDGERWIPCSAEWAKCFDGGPTRRLTFAFSADPGTGAGSGTLGGGSGLVAAGDRVYLSGIRNISTETRCPALVYHERGAPQWRGSADGSDGGFDPVFGSATGTCAPEDQFGVRSLAVAQLPDGRYEGWLVGQTVERTSNSAALSPPESMFMHLAPNGGWERYPADDALGDYAAALEQVRVAMVPTRSGSADAYVAAGGVLGGVLLKFTRSRGRWDVVPSESNLLGSFRAISSDGQGGLWVARIDTDIQRQFFFRLTDRPRRPVFSEVPNPAGSASFITAAAAGPEGSFWVATASDAVYRYDRLAGWDRVRVPGWDPSRVSTRPSQATAIALNQAGAGLVVGEQGRIAEIAGGAVRLDAAAGGALCDLQAPQPPCGTGRDLRAAALAPDGSAIVAGVGLALLWRPAGGEFRAIERPDAAAQTTITAVAMPAPERAWLTTDSGFVFAGRMGAPGEWSWQAESFNERGDPLTLDRLGGQLALGAIAVDADGHGFALGNNGVAHGYRVGATGVILERSGDGEHPWRRLAIPYHDSFTSVALPVGGGEGALFGAERGAIYTYDGQRLEPARLGEWPRSNFGFAYATDRSTYERPVVGLALLPGAEPGQSEAWAALQGSPDGDSSLLHWASDPTEPLLDPVSHGAAALADTPAPRPGELSFASFGYSRCSHVSCPEMTGTDLDSDLYARRIAAELAARGGQPAGPSFALFSGDSSDQLGGAPSSSDPAGRLKPARFSELVAEPLDAAGVPLFGAIGAGDLSGVGPCTDGLCGSLAVGAGENLGWRQGFARRPAPWGRGEAAAGGGYEFEPVSDAEIALRPDEQGVDAVHVADPDGSMGATSDIDVPTGGASTHYALDVVRDGEALARLVFIDSSLRSLQAADPIQNPLEPKGQLDWLAAMLCFAGEASPSGEPCSRERGEQAVVVTNAPTYSYGPGQLNQTALDAALVEQALLDGEATVVISGRIGWNALYYALGSGIHEPQPGGDYPERAPQPLAPGGRVLPFVVSAGAGRFAADAPERSASAGYWHGYTIVRLGPSGAGGDPAGDHSSKVIVEQRPLLDWIHLAGENHVVAPGARLGLQGFGREPIVATDFTEGNSTVVRDDEIDSAAITHRYDLVLADPEAPWLACEAADAECQSLAAKLAGGSRSFDSAAGFASGSAQDDMGGASVAASGAGAGENPCEPYLCLPQRIGAIDRITGVVKAGDGKYPDTFAIAMLSVDDEVATYPLVFEKSPSFVIQPLRLPAPEPGPPPGVPSAPNAPAPPPVPKPSIPNPTLPELPALPGVPPLAAAQPPEPQPPAPPTPPPPTEQPSPLDLTVSPTALTVATPAAVIQPPTPPVNPAPPSGARREARQRQAAAQKSGADSEEASEMQSMHGDLAEGPPSAKGVAMTRRDRTRPAPSFTTLARPDQPSAWAQGALYGGGIALMSLVLALGLNTARPTPRRRPPEVPAPALAPARRRW